MRFLILLCLVCGSVSAAELEGVAKEFVKDGVFTCPNTKITFALPDLNAKKLKVRYAEATPGITWQVVFAEGLGHIAAVTYTKIRAEYPKTDAVLERTASLMKQEAMRDGGYLEWCGFLSNDKGKVLQCVVRYPGAGHPVSVRNAWLDAMENIRTDVYELRQYIVRDGYMLEFKLFIPQFLPKGTFDEDQLLDKWVPTLKDFVSGCGLVDEGDSYWPQMKTFKRPKSYFRFVFEDPSRK